MRSRKMLWTLLLMVALSWTLAVQGQTGTTPSYVPVQGYLSDEAGLPLDGELTVVFSLYSELQDPTDGAAPADPLHVEQQAVSVRQGEFTAFIGDAEPLDLELFANQPEGGVFLGVKVGEDPELQPRLRLGSVPFAAFAQTCGDSLTVGGRAPSSFADAEHSHVYPATFADTADVTTISSGPEVLFETAVTCPEAGSVIALASASTRWTGSSSPGKCSLNIRLQGETAASYRQTDAYLDSVELLNSFIPISMNRVYRCNAGSTVNVVLWGIAGLGPCTFTAPTLTAFFIPG